MVKNISLLQTYQKFRFGLLLKKMIKEPKCLRCGKCCGWFDSGGVRHWCKFLIHLPSGKTVCRIYNHRLGTEIALGVRCILRKGVPFDFIGCPYNTGENPILNV